MCNMTLQTCVTKVPCTLEVIVNGWSIASSYKQDELDSDDWDTQNILEFLILLDYPWSWYMCWDSWIVTAHTSLLLPQ